MKKGNHRNQFKIKETYPEEGITLEEVRASMTDWFEEVLNLAKMIDLNKKINLNATNSHSIIEIHSNSKMRGISNE